MDLSDYDWQVNVVIFPTQGLPPLYIVSNRELQIFDHPFLKAHRNLFTFDLGNGSLIIKMENVDSHNFVLLWLIYKEDRFLYKKALFPFDMFFHEFIIVKS